MKTTLLYQILLFYVNYAIIYLVAVLSATVVYKSPLFGKKIMEVSTMTERRHQLLDLCEKSKTRKVKKALKEEADPVVKKGLQAANSYLVQTNLLCIILSAIAVYMLFEGSALVKVLGIALVVIEFILVFVLKKKHSEAIEYLRIEADDDAVDA